jgi:hypothetical protein
MTRSSHPDRIHAAQRAGVIARLTQNERVNEIEAERLVARWEREAERSGRQRGSMRYWEEGWAWIEAQRRPQADEQADEQAAADKTDMSAVGDDGQVFGG